MPSLCAGDSHIQRLLTAALSLLFVASKSGECLQYKVGDLDSWGIPPPSFSNLYSSWSLNHHFLLNDSLLFLYPPSQDNVVQLTDQAFNACNVKDPILEMEDGNSVFNLTVPGTFYFASGVSGHCEKRQKIKIAVPDENGRFLPPASGPASGPASDGGGPVVFGPTADGRSVAPERLRGVFGGGFSVVIGGFGWLVWMV